MAERGGEERKGDLEAGRAGEAALPLRAAADCTSLSGNSIKSSLNSWAASGATSVNDKLKNKLKLADICCVFLHLVIKSDTRVSSLFFFFFSFFFCPGTFCQLVCLRSARLVPAKAAVGNGAGGEVAPFPISNTPQSSFIRACLFGCSCVTSETDADLFERATMLKAAG